MRERGSGPTGGFVAAAAQHEANCCRLVRIVARPVEEKSRRLEHGNRRSELGQGVGDDAPNAGIGESVCEHAAHRLAREALTPMLGDDAVANFDLAGGVGSTLVAAYADEPCTIYWRQRFRHVVQTPLRLVGMLRQPQQRPSNGVGIVQLRRPTRRYVHAEHLA